MNSPIPHRPRDRVFTLVTASALLVMALAGCGGGSNVPRVDAGNPPNELPEQQAPEVGSDGATLDGSPIVLVNADAESLSQGSGWSLDGACTVSRDTRDDTAALPSVTAPGNGRAHFRLAQDCSMTQLTDHVLVAGEAISVVFDTALADGEQATLQAALVAVDEDGSRRRIAEQAFPLSATGSDWQSHQLLTGYTTGDALAGARLALEFNGAGQGSGILGLDAIALTRHRSDIESGVRFSDRWSSGCDERWTGEHFFANRLRDWRVSNGRLITSDPVPHRPLRTVHRVTSAVRAAPEDFTMSVNTGIAEGNGAGGWSGFLFGAGFRLDHRGAALIHNRSGRNGGLIAGIDADGRAFLADNGIAPRRLAEGATSGASSASGATLQLDARFSDDGRYTLDLFVRDAQGNVSSSTTASVPAVRMLGNLALASEPGGSASSHWFDDFTGSGAKLAEMPQRAFGPVLFASHTLSRGTLTLNAQYPPTCATRFEPPVLQAYVDDTWRDVATAAIDPDAYTARFIVAGWTADRDTPYRVRTMSSAGEIQDYEGVVRADPVDTAQYVLGLFNCRPGVILSDTEGWIQQNNQKRFTWTRERIVVPHEQLLANAALHEPDMIAFVGDQIYEFDPNGLIDKNAGLDALIEDYLWKWFQFGWSVRELTRSTPSFIIPDDHDVYQGNVWAQGGREAASENVGGYVQPASFIRVVQRTQTGSLPDPFDPTPVDQGIEVYYTDLVHGGIGTAVLEDRKFKAGPDNDEPKRLLGDRQLAFLDVWARDWDGQQMKMVISQSPFAQSTTHAGATLNVNGFDQDSNGWPKGGRDAAVAALRRARAPHISGDQHLGMTLQHGIEAHNDAVYEFAGPSMLNIFPRIFDPRNTTLVDGVDVLAPGPGKRSVDYLGEFVDPHGNLIDVKAAANPDTYYAPPPPGTSAKMDALGIGYGIVRLERATRRYTFEAWPGNADPGNPLESPYSDWPIVIEQSDNDGRQPAGFLPERIAPVAEPVVQVVNEASGELIYAMRSTTARVELPVYDATASYSVTLSDIDSGYREQFTTQRVTTR